MFVHKQVQISDFNTVQLKGHRWYQISEDVKYPSITSVLGAKEKPFLNDWRNMLGETKATAELKRCADRGTAVHDMCEKYLMNYDNPCDGHTTENKKLFNQLKITLNKINNILIQEGALYSDVLQTAGRVDCIAEYMNIPSVIDFKSSTNLKTEAMIEDYYLQETFYALAFYEMTGIVVNQIVTIMVVERAILPVVWVRDIAPFIAPLSRRIQYFYDKHVN
jgi:genome maintenance exonuclease 1